MKHEFYAALETVLWSHPQIGDSPTVGYIFGSSTNEQPSKIELLEANHPVPRYSMPELESLEAVRGLSSDNLVIVLLSGGGSALIPYR